MKVIFGTTNKRKIEDLQTIIDNNNLELEILTLSDIGWNLGEIEENGATLEENSLIKAQAIYNFCKQNDINYPIITDDAGLFVDVLNGEPGIYTARYADEDLKNNPELPKYECVNKLLRKLNNLENRKATYKCVVTCMLENGEYFQTKGESEGSISNKIIEPINKPYFYSVFILNGENRTFNLLTKEEIKETYRYKALEKTLKKCNNNNLN